MMIEDDLCLSAILGLSMRLFLNDDVAVEGLFSSDSEFEADDDALERGDESCALCCCNEFEI